MMINIVYGHRPVKDLSAIQKYAYEIQKRLPHSCLIDCPKGSNGLIQEFIDYFVYPWKVLLSPAHITHITSLEYAYLAFLPIRNVFVTVHDIFPLTIDKNRARFNYRFRIWLGLWALRLRAKKIFCDSEYTREELLQIIPSLAPKLVVCYLGKDEQYVPVREKIPAKYGLSSKKYVLYIGSEISRKNFISVLRAFAIIAKKHKDILLVKVGSHQDASNRVSHEKFIADNGLQKRVVFTGFVAEKDLPAFYSTAEVFVFPSLAEGFGLPVLEAMACGCPVICSDKGSLAEVGRDAVIKVDPKDVGAISNGIERVLTSDATRKELVRKGLVQSKKFNWNTCVRIILKSYSLTKK